jgi:hypothetical protein
MKNLKRTLLTNVLGLTLALCGFVPSSQAVDYYWNASGAGNWDTTTANWTTNPAGGAATTWVNSTSSNDAYFSAGTATTGAFTVTVTSVVDMDDLIFQEGSVTLAGSGGTFRIANGGGWTQRLIPVNHFPMGRIDPPAPEPLSIRTKHWF